MYEMKWNEVLADLIGLMWDDQSEFEHAASRVSVRYFSHQQSRGAPICPNRVNVKSGLVTS